jgi:hypothetical protein
MQPFQTGTRRDIGRRQLQVHLGRLDLHRRLPPRAQGRLDGGVVRRAWGGTAFALPINYDTDRYDASAAYNTRLFQASLQYTFSHFTDNNLFVNLPYPFSNTARRFSGRRLIRRRPATTPTTSRSCWRPTPYRRRASI